nr:translocating chain-associated membrane protein 2-like [Nothobranchius furzeri]
MSEEEDTGARDMFLFVFQFAEDMELFLKACADEQGLRASAMFGIFPSHIAKGSSVTRSAALFWLQKVNRRLHLSKSKNTKFNESGQLCVFHLVSSVWSFYILITEGYLLHPSSLWENYPHTHLRFQVKLFYLTQLAYWLHALPELYFQKVRKEEIPRQLQYISLYLLHISAAYLLNLSRVGLVLVFLQYVSELGFHIARLLYFTDESHQKMFDLWAVSFVFTRMATLTLMFLAVGFGLARAENQGLDLEMGNFNTVLIR